MKQIIPKRSEMVAIIQAHVRPVSRTESVPFHSAAGRVCAEDVYSKNTLPNQPVSRFDGIAVRWADFMQGPPDTRHWLAGDHYAYCNTGIAMPRGYDTVIAIEDVDIHEQGIVVREQPLYQGEMVNQTGDSMQAGERLTARGELIQPAHVGLFAAGGVDQVLVFAKPTVGIIPTGDELVPPTAQVPSGKNVESNSYMIAAYLDSWGAKARTYPITADEPATIRAALELALAENDAAVIIAGSSVGTKDFTLQVLAELGELVVPELAHGPGRKSSLSLIADKSVLGVAGPPLGAQITCDLYLMPFINRLRGPPPVDLATLEVICDDPFVAYPVDFCERVHIYKARDGHHIRSVFAPKTTRAQMQTLANGNYYRPAGSSHEPGETTVVELLLPLAHLPAHDRLHEILGDNIEPYE